MADIISILLPSLEHTSPCRDVQYFLMMKPFDYTVAFQLNMSVTERVIQLRQHSTCLCLETHCSTMDSDLFQHQGERRARSARLFISAALAKEKQVPLML